MVHGNSLGLPHFEAPVDTKRCGTFFWLTYLWIAVLVGVPRVLKRQSTFSCSMSWRVTSTDLGGEYPSSIVTNFTVRPLMPPVSLTIFQKAWCAWSITP